MNNAGNKFSWRAFVSVMTAVSFIVMTVTGIVLYVTPPGRVAHWTNWTIWGLSKEQWSAMHIWFSLVFLIAAIFHIYYNWKPLLSYFKSKLTKKFAFRMEWVLAVIICVVTYFGTYKEIVPFSSIMKLNDKLKNSWEKRDQAAPAPIPHAEILSLEELADKTDMDINIMVKNLEAAGISVESTSIILGDLAEENNMSPNEVYSIMIGKSNESRGGHGYGGGRGASGGEGGSGGGGGGFGRMTLKEVCQSEELDLNEAIEKLRTAGFDANANSTIREIADKKGVHPSEIRNILLDD